MWWVDFIENVDVVLPLRGWFMADSETVLPGKKIVVGMGNDRRNIDI